jgi:hypothetical protein
VRRTLAVGKGSGARHLLNLTATDGKPVADPEDDKLWLSLESKHTLLEFDFARTWQQELHVMEGAVKRIQQAWRIRTGQQHAAAGVAGSRAVSPVGSCRSGLLNKAGSMPVDPLAEADGRSSTMQRPADSSSYGTTYTNLQAATSNMLTASSYTGDSYTSYTLYSSDPSMLSGGVSLQSQGTLSFAQPSNAALGLPAASSTDLSYTSGITEGSSSIMYSHAAAGSPGGPAAAATSVSLAAGSAPQQQWLAQQGPYMQGCGSIGGGFVSSSTGPRAEREQHRNALDLAAGLTGFKAGGLIPSSSDPTPRLAYEADV